MAEDLTFESGGQCSKCGHTFPALTKMADEYFRQGHVVCPQCQNQENLWQSAVDHFRQGFPIAWGLRQLGVNQTIFQFTLVSEKTAKIDFTDHGIPTDAIVLSVNYTANGPPACHPVEIHSNDARARRYYTSATVFGIPIKDAEANEVEVSVFVTWVCIDDETDTWFYLLDAFEAGCSGNYSIKDLSTSAVAQIQARRIVLSVYTALELASRHIVQNILEKTCNNGLAKEFSRRTDSAHLFSVMLPLLAKESQFPVIPEEIKTRIEALRSLRNNIIHDGGNKLSAHTSHIGFLLCAAVFGIEYIKCLERIRSQAV